MGFSVVIRVDFEPSAITDYDNWSLLSCTCDFNLIWFFLHCVPVVRTQKHFGWSSVWWRWLLPRNAVSLPRPTSHQMASPFVGRMTALEPCVLWSMPPATRRSCADHTVRTATVAMGTSVSLLTEWPNFELPCAILATRPNSAKPTTPLASVHMAQGNMMWYIAYSIFDCQFKCLSDCSENSFMYSLILQFSKFSFTF